MFNTKDIQERYTKRNEDVTAAAVKIHALIDDCQKYYKADVTSETWKSYLQYIDELIVEGLLKVFLLSRNVPYESGFFWKLEMKINGTLVYQNTMILQTKILAILKQNIHAKSISKTCCNRERAKCKNVV